MVCQAELDHRGQSNLRVLRRRGTLKSAPGIVELLGVPCLQQSDAAEANPYATEASLVTQILCKSFRLAENGNQPLKLTACYEGGPQIQRRIDPTTDVLRIRRQPLADVERLLRARA